MSEVFNTIKNRRTVGGMNDQVPPKESIDRMLEAGTWAPNHHLTEPWKFIVVTGEARDRLSKALKKVAYGRVREPDSESGQKKIEKIGNRLFLSPVIIFIVYVPSDNPKADPLEDRAAVAITGQNMMLVAEEEGLNTQWLSGPIYNVDLFRDALGLVDDEEVYGLMPVGYSSINKQGKRTPFEEKTVYLDK